MATTFNWIYLGNSAQRIDPGEGNSIAENAQQLTGTTWGSSGSPLFQNITSATMLDWGGNAGVLDMDNTPTNDQFLTDIGGGQVTLTFDAATIYTATITYADGTTALVTAVIVQDTAGNLFLAPDYQSGMDEGAFEAKPIQSLTLNSVSDNALPGLTVDRYVTGFDDGYVDGTSGSDLIDASYVEPVAEGSDKIDNNDAGLAGSSGNDDYVRAGAGNDTVYAGLGNDSVYGGDGNDLAYGGDGRDLVLGEAGEDTLYGGAGIDSLYSGIGNDLIYGGDDGDILTSDTGNDTLFGDAGNDTLIGGAGRDALYGGTENDTVLGGTDDDTVSGDSGDDSLLGEGGNDSLSGGSGHDSLYGGSENDTLTGGAAGDHLDGGAGTDTADYTGSSAGVNVTINASASGGDATGDTLANFENLAGSGLGDTLIGDGGANVLSGQSGNDQLYGAGGSDTIYGSGEADLIYGGLNDDRLYGDSGNDTLYFGADNDSAYGGDGNDLIDDTAGTEDSGNNVIDAGTGDDTVRAGGGNDTVTGGTGADSLLGESGNDSLSGGGDGDTLSGGLGEDTLAGGTGDDNLAGDEGNDSLSGEAGNDSLAGGLGNDSLSGGSESDTLAGGEGEDTLAGGTGEDSLSGGLGRDLLQGEDGNDSLTGGEEADTLLGGSGHDALAGDAGNDSLAGGDGNDSLAGGAGSDTLTGGLGSDLYELTPSGGSDLITDFDMALSNDHTQDQLDVSDLVNLDGSPVKSFDVAVGDDGTGNALLTFPGGETLVLAGVSPTTVAQPGMLFAMGVPCFAAGTRIATPGGERRVEEIAPGEMVLTADGQVLPVLWHGRRHLGAEDLAARPELRPVQIRPGAFGNGRALVLSPQHALAVAGPEGPRLVRARHLAWLGRGARVMRRARGVSYHHLLLPRHALVLAEGCAAESFYPGPQALAGLPRPDVQRLVQALGLPPGLATQPQRIAAAYGPRCLPLASRSELRRDPMPPAAETAEPLRACGRASARAATESPFPPSRGLPATKPDPRCRNLPRYGAICPLSLGPECEGLGVNKAIALVSDHVISLG